MAWLGGCVYAADLRGLVETWSTPLSPPRSWPRLGAPATCTADSALQYQWPIQGGSLDCPTTFSPPLSEASPKSSPGSPSAHKLRVFTAMPRPFSECPSFLMPPGSNLPCWCWGPGPFPSSGSWDLLSSFAQAGGSCCVWKTKTSLWPLFPVDLLQFPDPERQGTNAQAPGPE